MRVWTTATVAAARIACRQVGYPFSNGTRYFGQESGPVGVEIIQCTGDEERVEQCVHWGWSNDLCSSSCTDLSVSCRGEYVQRTMYTFESTHVYMYTHKRAHTPHTCTHTHIMSGGLAFILMPYLSAVEVRKCIQNVNCTHTHARTHTHTHTCTRTRTIILIYVSAISYRCGEWSL